MKIVNNQTVRYILFIAVGLFLGWAFFHSSSKAPIAATEHGHEHSAEEGKAEVWTCSMHPQIRMDKPGKCPICGMDLIPLSSMGSTGSDAMAVHLTKEAAQLANVMTSAVSSQAPAKEIRLYGKVQADERLLQSQVTNLSGRIEKLLVNFTGEPVRKGQPLAVIYSPDLVTAQQELIEAARTKDLQPEIYQAALEKLHQWKLSDKQVASIESLGKVQPDMEITSNANGIVIARRVNNGDYVGQGSVLYEVADLSRVWVLFDAYESDLAFLQRGNTVEFTLQALPGQTFNGKIAFIDPVIDPVNRVAKVRVEISNPGGKLKPEMFATGSVKANLDQFKGQMVVPRSAVLWTGKRSVVYVKSPGDQPIFTMRQIEIGPMLGNSYVVTDGLKEGEEIVTEGAFSVDAAAQLEGKPSMMNQEGGTAPVTLGHGTMAPGQPMSSAIDHAQFKVSGNCDMCKERIETAAKSVAGVSLAEWNVKTKAINVHFDGTKTNSDAIQKAIANVGHDTEKYKAPADVYSKLPECCLYTRQ